VNTPSDSQSIATIDPYGAEDTALKWEYTLKPPKNYVWSENRECWAYCNLESRSLDKNIDFSDISQVTFYIRSSINYNPLEVSIFTRKKDETSKEVTSYEYILPQTIIATTNWKKITVNVSDYSITPWTKDNYHDAPVRPELQNVYAFGFASKLKEPMFKNNIWIDELALINNNGSIEYILHFNDFNGTIQGADLIWNVGWGQSS